MKKKLNIALAALGFFGTIAALLLIFSMRGMYEIYRLKAEQQRLSGDIAVIKKENKKTENQIYELSNNKQYIAEMAREKLNMIKNGEIVFKFFGNGQNGQNGKKNMQVQTPDNGNSNEIKQ